MKNTWTLAVWVLICAPAWAGPNRALTAVPKLVGRTVSNMVTFRHKSAAFEEWANLGVAVADGVVSHNVLSRIPGAYEANPIFGKHPSLAEYLEITIPLGMYGASLTHWTHEQTDGTKAHWQTYLPVAINGGIHGAAIAWNEHELREACERASIVCR